ncbi:MAG TPA: DMT family transporter [Propioniciclava tarda]|nr:DMT family transporter [Propioniciclava tarda]HQA30481.1 DMT family transporter [Propioniciclava tarda]HQD60914.1 DMT family transporter [Propioniciclava tarda]
MLLCGSAIWGFAFAFQVMGAHVGAFSFNSSRFLLGAGSLLPLIAWVDRRSGVDRAVGRRRWRSVLGPGALCGVFLFGGASFQQIALADTSAGNAAFVTGLYVVLVPLVGILLGHRATLNIWIGALVAVAGLYLLTMTGGIAQMNPGDLLCLVSTLFWTAHILSIGYFARRIDPLRLAVAQFVAMSLYGVPFAFATEVRPFADLGTAIIPILYAGVASVGLGYTLQVLAQRDALESHAALIMSLESVFGAIGGALLLGERMSGVGYVGAALMLVGIVVSQLPRRGQPHGPAIPVPEPPSTALEL